MYILYMKKQTKKEIANLRRKESNEMMEVLSKLQAESGIHIPQTLSNHRLNITNAYGIKVGY